MTRATTTKPSRAPNDEAPPLPPHGRNPVPLERFAPCAICGSQALTSTLANLGERCAGCFKAYCAHQGLRSLPPSPGTSEQKDQMTPKAYTIARLSTWTKRHGLPMTPHQIHVLKACQSIARVFADATEGQQP